MGLEANEMDRQPSVLSNEYDTCLFILFYVGFLLATLLQLVVTTEEKHMHNALR